jgi:hypothetical protein
MTVAFEAFGSSQITISTVLVLVGTMKSGWLLAVLVLLRRSAYAADQSSVCGKPTDPCRTPENVAECNALVAANCSSILVRESCPVHFGCGDTNRTTPLSVCGSPTDACMNQENYKQCKSLEEGGCIKIGVLESCPLQFACTDDDPATAPSACGKPTDPCMNRRNWARCKALEKRCEVLALESCPLQFACKPKASVCGSPTDSCMTPKLWRECRALERAGCQSIVSGESCPHSGFQCADPPDSCARFQVFATPTCRRGAAPVRRVSIPVWSKPLGTCGKKGYLKA